MIKVKMAELGGKRGEILMGKMDPGRENGGIGKTEPTGTDTVHLHRARRFLAQAQKISNSSCPGWSLSPTCMMFSQDCVSVEGYLSLVCAGTEDGTFA